MKNLSSILFVILIIILAAGFVYGIYKLRTMFDYKLLYKAQVEQTIRNMVIPEALK